MSLKIALLGCGAIGLRHAQEIVQQGHQLVAVCDIVPEKGAHLASTYACAFFTDLNEMLASCPYIDLVSICTPNYLHAPQTISCLHAGKHVLCEKPMAISTADARKMVETSQLTGKKIWVVKQNRFNPPVKHVKNLLNEDKLGNILSFQINCFWNRPELYYANSWRGKMNTDGGTLFTQFSHFIDLMHWFFGDIEQIQYIRQNAMHPYIEFEDSGLVNFVMSSGAMGNLHYNVNAYQKNMEGSMVIFGDKGTIKIGGQYLNTIEYQIMASGSIPFDNSLGAPNEYGTYQGSMRNHGIVYQQLHDAVNHDPHVLADALDGLKTVETIERIYSSVNLNLQSKSS